MKIAGLKDTNISLALDSYDDIFSDFDPRSYSDRALSEDFLQECIRAARDKTINGVELRLLIPRRLRRKTDESMIKKRLCAHFKKHHDRLSIERSGEKRKGAVWVTAGTALALATVQLHGGTDGFLSTLLFVIFEPASWFSFWTGLDKIFFEDQHNAQKRQFYAKMAKTDIRFEAY